MAKGKFNMKQLLNDASKTESAGTPAAAPSGFVIQDIPYDKIKPSEKNFYGLRDIEELAAQIEEAGLLHNLVVAEADEAGLYELISGERRYKALGLLKWATVPCKVEKRETAAIDELKLILANSTARELTEWEKTKQAGRIKELLQQMKAEGHKFKGRMRDIVADILKVSSAQIGRMDSINKNLSPELKQAFEREEIGITAAYNASLLKPEEQAAALENFRKTGEFDAAKPKPPPSKKNTDGIPPADNPPPPHVLPDWKGAGFEGKYDDPKRAYVFLTDTDGGEYEASGSLAIIAAVDGEDFGGYLSTSISAASPVDIIMLATAIVGECMGRLPPSETNTLKANLAALFDGGGGGKH